MKRTTRPPRRAGRPSACGTPPRTPDRQDVPAETSRFRPVAPVDDDGRTHLRESLLLLDEERQVVAFARVSSRVREKASKAILLEEVRVEREARGETCPTARPAPSGGSHASRSFREVDHAVGRRERRIAVDPVGMDVATVDYGRYLSAVEGRTTKPRGCLLEPRALPRGLRVLHSLVVAGSPRRGRIGVTTSSNSASTKTAGVRMSPTRSSREYASARAPGSARIPACAKTRMERELIRVDRTRAVGSRDTTHGIQTRGEQLSATCS